MNYCPHCGHKLLSSGGGVFFLPKFLAGTPVTKHERDLLDLESDNDDEGAGVLLREIPPEYTKGMDILSVDGATSVVFDKNNGEVRMFTRDKSKVEWYLSKGITQIPIKFVKKFQRTRKTDKNKEFNIIYIFDMPKLKPVENSKVVSHIVRDQLELFNHVPYVYWKKDFLKKTFKEKIDDLKRGSQPERKAGEYIEKIGKFLENPKYKDFCLDLKWQNLMETQDGELVLLDPFVDFKLIMFTQGGDL